MSDRNRDQNLQPSLQVAMQILAAINIPSIISKSSVELLVKEVCDQSELAVSNYELSIKHPSTVAVSIPFRVSWQLQKRRLQISKTVMFDSEKFDFDDSCKKKATACFI
jgi:hypothetical protein